MTTFREATKVTLDASSADEQALEPFENLDRIATVEMRQRGIPQGIVRQLYGFARDNGPLSHRLARSLLECAGKRIAIFTGIVAEPLPHGEVDGPIGASILAQTLEELGVAVDVIVPEAMTAVVDAIRSSLRARFEILNEARHADDYIGLVAIEKLGRTSAGTTHTILGTPIEQDFAADDLVEQFNRDHRLTVSIADGGNELGFGAIFAQAIEVVPRGRDCGCPCGAGIVSQTATQLLFPAAVSDFGAYAVSGALALLAGRAELAPIPDLVGNAIAAAVGEGCIDGGTFRPHVLADDGIPLKGVEAVVGVMRTIVEQAFRTTPREG
jgi:hypothetical protein